MSYCREEGKDKIIFVTEEDHKLPSEVTFENLDLDEEPGLILEDGNINWNCPCLGGMATGPCGPEFREAFSCFHYSEADPKGSDCYEQFRTMQECMAQHPTLYDYDDKESDQKDPLNEDITNDSSVKNSAESTESQESTSDAKESNK